jgi:hypothetical protein
MDGQKEQEAKAGSSMSEEIARLEAVADTLLGLVDLLEKLLEGRKRLNRLAEERQSHPGGTPGSGMVH